MLEVEPDATRVRLVHVLSGITADRGLMIFNRTKNSSSVRMKMYEGMEALPDQADGDSRHIFIKESEPGKEIIITTQLYDIPSDKQ